MPARLYIWHPIKTTFDSHSFDTWKGLVSSKSMPRQQLRLFSPRLFNARCMLTRWATFCLSVLSRPLLKTDISQVLVGFFAHSEAWYRLGEIPLPAHSLISWLRHTYCALLHMAGFFGLWNFQCQIAVLAWFILGDFTIFKLDSYFGL